MRSIKLINKAIFVSLDSPKILLGGAELAFRQGDLDGACGLYAVMTAMVAAGILRRSEVENLWSQSPDRRTKFYKSICSIPALVQDGTAGRNLIDLIVGAEKFFHKKTTCAPYSSVDDEKINMKGRSLIGKIKSVLEDSGMPVILRLDWEGKEAHWVVVVGYEEEGKDKIINFLVLDPGFEVYRTQLWNAILSARPVKNGPKPYSYWCGNLGKNDSFCQIAEAIFLF